MDYLSFDIECCDGRHICEFGYVRFDEEFHLIEKECLLINPEHRITLSYRRSRGDMKLHFPDKEYFAAPTFSQLYDRIRGVINAPDTKIIGFSMRNDAGFLDVACSEHKLPQIKFRYLDFQQLYRGYTRDKQDASVGRFAEELGIDGLEFHKSDDDAYAVMLGLKKIAETEGLSLNDTLLFLGQRRKEFEQQIAQEKAQRRFKKIVEGNKKMQNGFLRIFTQKTPLNTESSNEVFSGKVVCIGTSLQTERFSDFVSLVKLLYENGARYTPKTSECDVFITFNNAEDARYNSAKICAKGGKDILFLSLTDALSALDSTEEDLSKVDYVAKFYEETEELHEVKTSDGGATIGAILGAKGSRKKRRRRHTRRRPAEKQVQ